MVKALVAPRLEGLGLLYRGLNAAYNLGLKGIVLSDVMAVEGG